MLKSIILIGGHHAQTRFNKFYRYDELTKLLKAYVKELSKPVQDRKHWQEL